MGPDPYLSVENERKIVEWIIQLAKCGFPIQKQELIKTVQKIVIDEKIKTPFKEGKPGQKWYLSFMRRHPEISIRTPESIDKSRAKLTEEYIKSWFKSLEAFLESVDASDILTCPSRIFNADESGFSLCPKTGKVLGPRGYKNLFEVKKGNEKDNITVLVTFSADGNLGPPCIVYPYVKPPRAIAESMPPDWILGKSDTGYMRSDVFFEYVANGLHEWIVLNNIKKPILFFVDGHRSHMSIELSKFCDNNGIILYALPPNATHLMQPADVAVFKPMKAYWRQAVRTWQNANLETTLTKVYFAPVFKQALFHENISDHIKNGFKRCGLFPYNPEAVDYSKCVQNMLEKNMQDNVQEVEQIEALSFADFQSTHKVLTTLRSNILQRVEDVDWLLNEVHVLEEKILGDNSAVKENIVANDNATTVSEYEIKSDGCLTLVETNKPEPVIENNSKINESQVKILRIDILQAGTNTNEEQHIDEDFTMAIENTQKEMKSELLLANNTDTEFETYMNNANLEKQEPTCENNEKENNVSLANYIDINKVDEEECLLMESRNVESISDTNKTKENSLHLREIRTNDINTNVDYFKKHLKYPKPLQKSSRPKSGPSTSAISAKAWRSYYIDKEKEKKEKENIRQRKREHSESKKLEKSSKNKKPKVKDVDEIRKKQKCGVCDDELDSDAEEEGEKNVGCDRCPKWFHLNCTPLSGQAYGDVINQEFVCDFCCD